MAEKKTKAAPNDHERFPHPRIMEALCEVHFQLPNGERWESRFLGELFKAVQDDFPIMEPVQQMGVAVELGPHGFGQRLMSGQQQARYLEANRKLMLQLADSVLTVNRVEDYPGWKRMRRDIIGGWEKVRDILHPALITRVGLRYINRLPRKDEAQTPGHWLKSNEYIPNAVLDSRRGLLSRVQVQKSHQSRTVVTLADEPAPLDVPASLIFDIDCIRIEEMKPEDKILRGCIDELHGQVWRVFSSALTENLRRLLETGED